MEKIKESSDQRGKNETELGDDCMHMVLFAAGTALLMACLKRALMVFLLERWRAWVFLFLNLVLLAILFTSYFSTSKLAQKSDCAEVLKIEKKRQKQRQCRCWSEQAVVESCRDCQQKCWRSSSTSGGNESSACAEEEDMEVNHPNAYKEEDMEAPKLSKEELNERAEAFIVMFRQHLVSDAKKSGKPFLI